MSAVPGPSAVAVAVEESRFERVARRLRYPLAVYLASRVVYLLVAVADIPLRNGHLAQELRNWDGKWYVLLARSGYPHQLPTHYGSGPGGWSTLGFEPLYPILMWLGGALLPRGVEVSGLLISLVGGGIATVEIAVLAERWFGPAASRRAVLFFCLFPGSIVFSMVYGEGLTLALVIGAMLCLEDRRWALAGLLGGAATAIEPAALAIAPACAAASLRELRRGGWLRLPSGGSMSRPARDRSALRSLAAPLLSVWGGGATGIFLWAWTGTPLATFRAQRIAWGEHSSLLSVPYDAQHFIVTDLIHWRGIRGVNLNFPVGILGAIFLAWGIWWMWQLRAGAPAWSETGQAPPGPLGAAAATGPRVGTGPSLAAWVWTLVVSVLILTSEETPPNPRMLLVAFPLLLAVAAVRTGRRRRWFLGVTLVLLVAMSIGSFAYGGLRP